MTHPQVTGIVLAGGGSTRFGGDKLATIVEGEPLLHRAIRAVASVADEVIVVIGADRPEPSLPSDLGIPAVVTRDAVPGGGPLVGLAAGLAVASRPIALLVGGDQPSLRQAILAELGRRLDLGRALDAGGEAAAPDVVALDEDGVLRPLPAALRVATVGPAAAAAVAEGSRSLRALFDRLRVEVVEPTAWRALDPAGDSLRDVDTLADLPPG